MGFGMGALTAAGNPIGSAGKGAKFLGGPGIDFLAGGGRTEVGKYDQWDESHMDASRADQTAARGQQAWLADKYKQRINGTAPSVAQNQLAETTAQNQQQQIAMAKSGGGPMGNAGAQYGAAQNAANINQMANRQGATLRAQEQMAAEQNMGQLSGQMRGQDIDMFGGEAGWQKTKADSWNSAEQAQAQADEAYAARRGSGIAGVASVAGGLLAGSDPSLKTDIQPAGGGTSNWVVAGNAMQGYADGYNGVRRGPRSGEEKKKLQDPEAYEKSQLEGLRVGPTPQMRVAMEKAYKGDGNFMSAETARWYDDRPTGVATEGDGRWGDDARGEPVRRLDLAGGRRVDAAGNVYTGAGERESAARGDKQLRIDMKRAAQRKASEGTYGPGYDWGYTPEYGDYTDYDGNTGARLAGADRGVGSGDLTPDEWATLAEWGRGGEYTGYERGGY